MNERMRHAITSALFEAFFVVLAVVLALAANEWRQNRADREHAASALASVIQELRANRTAADESRQYHSDLMEKIRTASHLNGRDFPRGFISPARLFRTAWEAATETGALSHMEYSTVLELSRVYAQQSRYETQVGSASELIYTELFRGGAAGMVENPGGLGALISTFAYRENELVSIYDETLALLDSVPAQPTGAPE